MRRHLPLRNLPLLAAAFSSLLMLGACGSGGDDDVAGGTESVPAVEDSTSTAGAPAAEATAVAPPPAGEVDCAFLQDPAQADGLVGLQLIPQLTSQDLIDNVRDGLLTYDRDLLATYLEALRPLGGTDYPGFGDPADEIEFYIEAAAAADELLSTEGPVPQAELDAFLALVGPPADFIAGQVAIGGAIGEVCG
jgi:hypothetical protein